MIDTLLQLVAPHLCTGCRQVGTLLCDNCKYDITSEPYERCIVCNRPSVSGVCKHHRNPYQTSWCVGERRDTLQRLIGEYKFQNTKASYRVLAELLHERLPDLPSTTVLVPVPTLNSHIRERGYDHIALITKRLAKLRHFTVESIVERTNKTMQRHSNRQQRIAQALQAFGIKGVIDPSRPYLIIDDVVTTGATITRVATLLKQAGAETIWVAVIARQPLD